MLLDCLRNKSNSHEKLCRARVRLGCLQIRKDPKGPPQVPDLEAAGRAVGLNIVAVDVNRPEEIEVALRELANKRANVVIVLMTIQSLQHRN
jgi:hypothetical protein